MKGKHTLNKAKYILIQFLAITLVALCLELFVFNFQSVRERFSSTPVKNCTLTLEDFEKINWTELHGVYISEPDPILVIEGLQTQVDRLTLSFQAEGTVPYVDFFYSNDEFPAFSSDLMTRVQTLDATVITVTPHALVNDLRVDLGDDTGVRLHGITVTINSTEVHLSTARIVAIIAIYFVGKFLFSLQREPDYGLSTQLDKHGNADQKGNP